MFAMPTPSVLYAGLIFGTIGGAAFVYGRKSHTYQPLVLGVGLIFYPYFVTNTALLYLIGIVLTAALFIWRE